MMNYKHLIFDIDGTLVDNERAVIATWQQTLRELTGKEYAEEELGFVLGIPGETTMRKLGMADPAEAFKVWGKNFVSHKSEIRLFPGIGETLSALAERGLALGIVTSRTRDELGNDYALGRIIGRFGTVVCVTDTARPKPHPDPLLTYLGKCHIAPQDVLYIGDSMYDARCADAAGIDFGWAQWGGYSAADSVVSRFVFCAPGEILDAV